MNKNPNGKSRLKLVLFGFALVLGATFCQAREFTPKETLQYFLNAPEARGGVVSQANLDGFDYRSNLRQAIDGNSRALKALFDYTLDGHLMGEGAISHMSILAALLRHLGDARYADTLGHTSRRVRDAVTELVDEHYARTDYWKAFPRT